MIRLAHRGAGSAGPFPTAWLTGSALVRLLAVCGVAALTCGGATTTAIAQRAASTVPGTQLSGSVAQTPINKKVVSRRSGLRLEVDSRWVNNFGYRPICVRVISPKPTTVEHLITIRLYAGSWNWSRGATAVEQDFEMPLGSTSAETVIACPQFDEQQRYWWDVWVDGVKDDDLSIDMFRSQQFMTGNTNSPISDNLKILMSGSPIRQSGTRYGGSNGVEAMVLPIVDLPERWIDYTTIDVFALTAADLKLVAETRPEVSQAISRWVQSGGQLWISGVGHNWERLDEVERLLAMTPIAPVSADDTTSDEEKQAVDDANLLTRGWKPVTIESRSRRGERRTFINRSTGRRRVTNDPAMIARLKRDSSWMPMYESESPQNRGETDGTIRLTDSSGWFVEQRLGLGTVCVFREMFDPGGVAVSWRMLMKLGVPSRDSTSPPTPLRVATDTVRTWESRHGMTPDTTNRDFADLLVPGVGQAPVTEFRVLITLFVLAIGPGNYWLLKRTHRLHLLVLTVPLMAAVLTIALFSYALVSDGFGTQVRVRSYTTLDQRTGEAACWARLSYYSGLAPGRGLTMPDDVAVYPIHSPWNEPARRRGFEVERVIEWARGEQWMTQGWLRSRTPTQYLTVRARQSPHRLVLTPAEDQLEVTNELGSGIQYVAVLDEAGNFFCGQELAERATTSLEPTTRPEVLNKLRSLFLENKPEVPPALADDRSLMSRTSGRNQLFWSGSRRQMELNTDPLANNLANEALAALVGTDGKPALDLPLRSYVAITETGPEVAIGLPNATEEASFHVMVGRW